MGCGCCDSHNGLNSSTKKGHQSECDANSHDQDLLRNEMDQGIADNQENERLYQAKGPQQKIEAPQEENEELEAMNRENIIAAKQILEEKAAPVPEEKRFPIEKKQEKESKSPEKIQAPNNDLNIDFKKAQSQNPAINPEFGEFSKNSVVVQLKGNIVTNSVIVPFTNPNLEEIVLKDDEMGSIDNKEKISKSNDNESEFEI